MEIETCLGLLTRKSNKGTYLQISGHPRLFFKTLKKPEETGLNVSSGIVAIVIKTTSCVSLRLPRSADWIDSKLLRAIRPVRRLFVGRSTCTASRHALTAKLMDNRSALYLTNSPAVTGLITCRRWHDQSRWLTPLPSHVLTMPRSLCGFGLILMMQTTSVQPSITVGVKRGWRIRIVGRHFK